MFTKRIRRRLLAVAVAFSGSACGYYNENLQSASDDGPPFKQGEALNFETVKTILARNHCFECHTNDRGNHGGINLETYPNVKDRAKRIAEVTASGFMPFDGPRVSAGDVAALKAWSDAGAPEH